MAKLYAEITSDKGGRVASKGGLVEIVVNLNYHNAHEYKIVYTEDSLIINDIFNKKKTVLKT